MSPVVLLKVIERYTIPKDPEGFFTVGKVRNQVLVLEFQFIHLLYPRCSHFLISVIDRITCPANRIITTKCSMGKLLIRLSTPTWS